MAAPELARADKYKMAILAEEDGWYCLRVLWFVNLSIVKKKMKVISKARSQFALICVMMVSV
jgi:hypothetical protein